MRTLAWVAFASLVLGAAGCAPASNTSSQEHVASMPARLESVVRRAPAGDVRPAHRVSVALPPRADGAVTVEDVSSRIGVSFVLREAAPAERRTVNGLALYPRAVMGGDLVHRTEGDRTEDYVYFARRPDIEALTYLVDVTRVAGLRLVANTLELLDASGAPRLRVSPPWIADANDAVKPATLSVDGCAVDEDPRGPWGRAIVPPGAAHCLVTVRWTADAYPIVVDPTWMATGSLVHPRFAHQAELLPSGKVLIVDGGNVISELYDPTTGTFAVTGSLGTVRGRSASVTLLPSGSVLVAGGINNSGTCPFPCYLRTAEIYSPETGLYTTTANQMATIRLEPIAALIANGVSKGKVLIAGGAIQTDASTPTAELFDPATRTFAPTGSMTNPRLGARAIALPSGKVLITGGYLDNNAVDTGEVYENGTFTKLPAPGMNAASGALLLKNGKVALYDYSVRLFDPSNNTSGTVTSFFQDRVGAPAIELPSGKILFIGGAQTFGGGNVPSSTSGLTTIEVYDPASNTKESYSALGTKRYGHTATLLANGRILVAGGRSSFAPTNPVSAAGMTSAEYLELGAIGAVCTEAADCTSEHCVDGVCCDTECEGACNGCNLPGKVGTCALRPVGDRGEPSCVPFVCNGKDPECPAGCTTNADCGNGLTCATESKTCIEGSTCAGHILTTKAGVKDCAPYNCVSAGECRTSCSSIDDCVSPHVCDATGKCILNGGGGESDDGGCATTNGNLTTSSLAGILFIAIAGAIRRRRR